MRICKDCKHYLERVSTDNYKLEPLCKRFKTAISLITGEVSDRNSRYCIHEREEGWLYARLENLCGREGRFYEPNEALNE